MAAGASAVMLGGVFASCHEAPGEIVLKDGKAYKTIRGLYILLRIIWNIYIYIYKINIYNIYIKKL